jgi:hypothetical protein
MTTSGERWLALVEQVAGMPEVITAMLREHAATAEGRCATCRVGNIATAQAQHPCRLWNLAVAAGQRRTMLLDHESRTDSSGLSPVRSSSSRPGTNSGSHLRATGA